MTSNPTIFEKALAEGTAYDDQIESAEGDFTAMELFELVETTDVRDACDLFRPVYDATNGDDGFVSIEVSPGAANDATATVSEAARLWATVDRPNVMIKVPGTAEGAMAVRQSIAAGINVNITLLFSIDAYKRVIDAYMGGLEDRVERGEGHRADPLGGELLREPRRYGDRQAARRSRRRRIRRKKATLDPLQARRRSRTRKLAYELFQKETASPRWKALAAKGATRAAPALGEHEHEESGVSRRDVRRGAHRAATR